MPNSSPIALFVTCLVDQVLPEIGIATLALLERAGLEVVFPPAQTCCGQPFFNSGFQDEAARLAKRTIEIFEPYETVVLPSGSCTTMLRHEYAGLFTDEPEWAARAEKLAAKTFELSEFLAQSDLLNHLSIDGPGTAGSPEITPEVRQRSFSPNLAARSSHVTYHDSCHMCRTLGLRAQPRDALAQAGAAIVEMQEPDRCCGFGGLFSLRMPEVSESISHEKLRQARDTGAAVLVTADPGCLMHMRRFTDAGDPQIEHLAVVLEALTR